MLANNEIDMQIKRIQYRAPARVIISGEHSVIYDRSAFACAINLFTTATLIEKPAENLSQIVVHFPKPQINILPNSDLKFQTCEILTEELVNLIETRNDFDNNYENFDGIIKRCQQKVKSIILQHDASFVFEAYKVLAYFASKQTIAFSQDFQSKLKQDAKYDNLVSQVLDQIQNSKGTPYNGKDLVLKILRSNITEHTSIYLDVVSDAQVGRGMGTSTSCTVSWIAVFLEYLSRKVNKLYPDNTCPFIQGILKNNSVLADSVNELAFQMDRIFHTSPSGLDNTVICYGGGIVFKKKATTQLTGIDLTYFPYDIYLIDSGVYKHSKDAIEKIAQLINHSETGYLYKNTINLIGEATEKIIDLVTSINKVSIQDYSSFVSQFEKLINFNQSLLRALELSHSKVEEIMAICMKYKIAVKITGAGVAGYCVCFLRKGGSQSQKKQFIEEIQCKNFSITQAQLDFNGLMQVKKKSDIK